MAQESVRVCEPGARGRNAAAAARKRAPIAASACPRRTALAEKEKNTHDHDLRGVLLRDDLLRLRKDRRRRLRVLGSEAVVHLDRVRHAREERAVELVLEELQVCQVRQPGARPTSALSPRPAARDARVRHRDEQQPLTAQWGRCPRARPRQSSGPASTQQRLAQHARERASTSARVTEREVASAHAQTRKRRKCGGR